MTGSADDILAGFGIDRSALIGAGGHSLVYALDDRRVVRILKNGGDVVTLSRLKAFLAEIDGRAAIATPLIEKIDAAGRYTVERRLPGTAMIGLLPGLAGEGRRRALANYIGAAGAVAAIEFPERPYGHLLAPAPIRTDTWSEFLRRSLDRALLRNGAVVAAEVGDVEDLRARAQALVEPLPPRPAKALVHGDYFPANVLLDATLAVSGLVDFSVYTVVGDPAYDIVTAPIFLEMIASITPADIEEARRLVHERLGEESEPAARCYRALAALTMADPAYAAEPYPHIYRWSLATLRDLARGDTSGERAG